MLECPGFWKNFDDGPRSCELIVIRRYSPPCTTAAPPQGGWLRHQRKFGEATEADAAGVVFLLDSSENHPGLAISGCFAIFSESLGHPSLCKEGTSAFPPVVFNTPVSSKRCGT